MKALHDYKNKRKFGHRIPGMNKPYSIDASTRRVVFDVKIPRAVFKFKYRIGAY